MSAMSDYLEAALLNHVFGGVPYTAPATVYLALFTVSPDDTGGGTEFAGGSYARQSVSYGSASSPTGVIANDAGVTFTNLPAGTLVAGAVYDALTAGNMLMYGTLTTPREIIEGDNLFIAIDDLTHTFG